MVVRTSVLQRLQALSPVKLWLASVCVSIVATEIITSGMEWLLKGAVTYDYLLTGFVAALLVASAVVAALLSLLNRLKSEAQRSLQLTKELAESEQRAKLAIVASRLALWDYDVTTGKVCLSEGWSPLLGGAQAPTITTINELAALVPEEELPAVKDAIVGALKGLHDSAFQIEHRVRNLDGKFIWVLSAGAVVERNPQGRALRMLGTNRDVTERRERDEALQLFATVFDAMDEAVVVTSPDNKIVMVNPAFTQITGYPAYEATGQNPRMLSSGRQSPEFYTHMWKTLAATGKWRGEIWNRRRNGEIYAEWLSVNRICDSNGKLTHHVAVFSDISRRKATEEQLHHMAHHDALTGLPNRTLFMDRLRQSLSKDKRDQARLAVMFLDLDQFKPVNDLYGHNTGDLLLQQVAQRLRDCMRESDTVARIGGDEFCVVLPSIEAAQEALLVAERILHTLRQPFRPNEITVHIAGSLGIAIYPDHGENADTLLRNADIAMYWAKADGRDRLEVFRPDMPIPDTQNPI